MSDLEQQPEKKAISRRTVTKAMAWSVPAIAIAAPVPAMAASGGPPVGTFGGACKLSGNSCGEYFVKGYVLEFTLTNNTGKDVYLYDQAGFEIVINLTRPPSPPLPFNLTVEAVITSGGALVTFPYLFPAGQTVTVLLNAGTNDNSSNLHLQGSVSFPWGHTPTPPDPDNHPPFVVPFDSPDTPPEQNPACSVVVPC